MIATAEQLLAILPLEAAIGYPAPLLRRIGHPVIAFGRLIDFGERRWNHGSPVRRRSAGVGLLLLLAAVAGGTAWVIAQSAGHSWGTIIVIVMATTGLAQRSLHDHIAAVLRPLATSDLAAARSAVSMIVGRDTEVLDESGVAVAAIESLSESFCDGVVAPAFWFLIAGLPGLAICKAINTADSMIGHRDARFLAFGWAAARADDLINLIPARIAGLLICIAGAGGLRVMLRDTGLHASPNGGWPEAAMAGVLQRRLGGAVSYDGELAKRAILGDGTPPDVRDLSRALAVYRRACLLLWLMVGGVAWLR